MLSKNDFLRCEDEPIHIPGMIQPIGALIAVTKNSLQIVYESDNASEVFDMSESSLGKKLFDLFPNLDHYLLKFAKNYRNKKREIFFDVALANTSIIFFDLMISSYNSDLVILEFIPKKSDHLNPVVEPKRQYAFINEALSSTESPILYEKVASYIKETTHYDRVMIYKFDESYNGEVLCEAKNDYLPSYLHLHYPAGDIPQQARKLYLENTIRIISDADYIPIKISTNSNKNLDMSLSFLRSVSPIHLEYMKNMGVCASMTISIIIDDTLWGLIACHNSTPYLPDIELVKHAEELSTILGSMIRLFEEKESEIEKSRFISQVDTTLFMLRKQLNTTDISNFLGQNLLYLRLLFESDGIIYLNGDQLYTHGINLPTKTIRELISFLQKHSSPFTTTSLKNEQNVFDESLLKECAGILYININGQDIIWTKKEQQYSLNWGGNPHKDPHETLSPRKSFEQFSQTVMYEAPKWKHYTKNNIEILESKITDFLFINESNITIEKQNLTIATLEDEKVKNYEQLIDMLVTMIDRRDSYTAGHTQRVSQLAVLLAQKLQLTQREIELLKQASKLHDIGKVVIPDAILLKPGKLNPTEYKLIQLHLLTGYEILSTIESYKEIAEIMKYHHEKYDGSGYPFKTKAQQIPLLSHIMIVTDAFDAMTSNRIYKQRKSIQEAVEEIVAYSGKWYHPDVVEALKELYEENQLHLEESTQLPLTQIENERFAYFFKDQMTGAFNESYLWQVLSGNLKHIQANYCLLIELHNMSNYNKKHGWHKGNKLLIDIASLIRSLLEGVLFFRILGDDFVVCFENQRTKENFSKVWENINLEDVYSTITDINQEQLIKHLPAYH